jgi:alkylation response protein AidB-like acyl-CoA dehydrogenase
MNFDLNDDQREVKNTAHDLLSQRSGFEQVRKAAEGGGYDDSLWKELAELGWTGIGIDEDHGGVGFGVIEVALLAEELGYAVTPSRFLANAMAGLVLSSAGSEDQKGRWLPGIASGEAPGTVAYARDGVAELVPDAEGAAVIVLVQGDRATVVEAGDATIEPIETIDATRSYARVTSNGGETLDGSVEAGLDRSEAVLSAELTGIAQRALDMTVAYVKERKQFGQPVAVFQAVSHGCAEMFLETESARSATYGAATAADSDPENLPFAASIAKATAAEAGRRVTRKAIQLHGGIGFTWEADVHWLFKRAHLDASQLGRAHEHRARIARLAAGLGKPVEALS